MVPRMVAHLHTVYRLQEKAASQLAWLEYDIQFRMELAASNDRTWTSGDPWQCVSCLPGPSTVGDPFGVAEVDNQPPQRMGVGKGKRPLEAEGDRGTLATKLPPKKPKRAGVCRLFNSAPSSCPYGKECIFVHRYNNCGLVNEHHSLACPFPPKLLPHDQSGSGLSTLWRPIDPGFDFSYVPVWLYAWVIFQFVMHHNCTKSVMYHNLYLVLMKV